MPHRDKTIWDKLNCTGKHPPLPIELSSMQRSRRNQSMDGGIDTTQNNSNSTGVKVPAVHREVQIAVLGAPGVGKTAIVSQFVHRSFPEKYKPTVENFHWIEYEINGGTVMLHIIDASGSNEFAAMRSLYMSKADAFLLVFSVDNPTSFEAVRQLREEILSRNLKGAPVLVVGNRTDLSSQKSSQLCETAEDFAMDTNCSYQECSAKEFVSVANLFTKLLKLVPGLTSELDPAKRRRQSLPTVPTGQKLPELDSLLKLHQKESRSDSCVIS